MHKKDKKKKGKGGGGSSKQQQLIPMKDKWAKALATKVCICVHRRRTRIASVPST